ADWTAWRDRWEAGHAIHALLFLAAFGLLAWAVPRAAPSTRERSGGAEADAAALSGTAQQRLAAPGRLQGDGGGMRDKPATRSYFYS
ncbi:MAG TPA: hypothetical protein VFS01_01720, partial [Rhizomicrobium sp.]|nr:hypothetical protein [Rhizomicrobium sp.]